MFSENFSVMSSNNAQTIFNQLDKPTEPAILLSAPVIGRRQIRPSGSPPAS
jgi:hypothetical protein